MDWSLLVGGLGLGALLKSVLDFWQSRKAVAADRLYQEKREAYLGLLGALHDAAVEPSDAHSKAYALWQTRCQLFGSSEVAGYAQEVADTNDDQPARLRAFAALVGAMRRDLAT
jgi:hypothetical protein